MKSWILKSFGYENFEFTEVEKPKISEGEVLVKVLSCGVCYRDIIDIKGGFPYTLFPTTPGHEIFGVVEEGWKEIKKGNFVISKHGANCGKCYECMSGRDNLCQRGPKFVHTIPGGYAEYVKAPESAFIKVEDEIVKKFKPEELAILFCAVGTAFRAIKKAEISPGKVVLITGASGGVGIHATMIAKAGGATVIAVTSSEEKKEKIKDLGADYVVVSKNGFHKEVMNITEGEGVDAVIENTGSISLESAIRSLKIGGTLIEIGNIKVERYPLNPGMIILREIKIMGSVGITTTEMKELINLLKNEKIKPYVSKTFPLQEAIKSHKVLEEKGVIGRIALIP